jgi:hypothetical protein
MKNALSVFKANSEPSNSSLFEIFSNDLLSRKKQKDEQKLESNFMLVDGINIDMSNYDDAIKKVKIHFLYNNIAKKAC